jgi:xanthine dehydrogenase accessory factor
VTTSDAACAAVLGDGQRPMPERRLVVVFASAVAAELAHIATHVGYDVVLLEPDASRPLPGITRASSVAQAALDADTDVVVADHDRSELGHVLQEALGAETRWIGVMGSPRHPAPHVPALRDRGVSEADIARVHRPIGLDIGSRTPGEIAVSTVAGLLASRAGRAGGFYDAAEPDAPAS